MSHQQTFHFVKEVVRNKSISLVFYELVSGGNKIVHSGNNLISRGNKFVSGGNKSVRDGYE